MMVCAYCGNPAPEPPRSCCGEVHFEEAPECPECGSLDVSPGHHEASFAAPECDYMQCNECEWQWWHS